jgi:hypothetical protein
MSCTRIAPAKENKTARIRWKPILQAATARNHRKEPRETPGTKPTETLTLAKRGKWDGGQGEDLPFLSLRRPPSMPSGCRARRPDLARPWASRRQKPREPPPCRSPRARSGHHGDAARRRRAHLAVDARAGEGAHRGTAWYTAGHRSLARSGEKKRRREKGKNELGFHGAAAPGVFVPPQRARSRPSPSDGRDQAAHHWASFGPGGNVKLRSGPRLPRSRPRAHTGARRPARNRPLPRAPRAGLFFCGLLRACGPVLLLGPAKRVGRTG